MTNHAVRRMARHAVANRAADTTALDNCWHVGSPRFLTRLDPAYFAGGAVAVAFGGAGGAAGAGGASAFQVSRMYSHFPSFLRETERNLPDSTTAPFTVALYVPDSQPVLPETPTSVLGFRTKTAPAAFAPAMSLVKNSRIAARPFTLGAPGGSSSASSAYSAATALASPALYAFSQFEACARMAVSS